MPISRSVELTSLPVAPTVFTATWQDNNDVLLTWVRGGLLNTSHRIYVRVLPSTVYTLLVSGLAADATSYNDLTVRAVGASVQWYVVGFNDFGPSPRDLSNILVPNPLPAAPLSAAAVVQATNDVLVTATRNGVFNDSHRLDVSVNGTAFQTLVTGLPATNISYNDLTVRAVDATVQYRPYAVNTAGSVAGTNSNVVVPNSSSPEFPNEPAGATQLNRWALDWSNVVAKNPPETAAQPWEGIYFQGAWGEASVDPAKADTVADQNGPVNPTTVGRYIYSAANAPSPFGDALIKPASFTVWIPPSNVKKVYTSMRVKFSSGWFLPANTIKLCNFWTAGNAAAIILEVHAQGAARPGYEGIAWSEPPYYLEIRVTEEGTDRKVSQLPSLNGGGVNSTMHFSDDNPRMLNDVWYQVEYVFDCQTGDVELYLDGALVADGTTNTWITMPITEFSFDGTLGGQCIGCPELPATQHWYQDDLYMSYTT